MYLRSRVKSLPEEEAFLFTAYNSEQLPVPRIGSQAIRHPTPEGFSPGEGSAGSGIRREEPENHPSKSLVTTAAVCGKKEPSGRDSVRPIPSVGQ